MNNVPLRWLLVGTGDIARKRVAAALGKNLVGVVGGRDRAAALARECGATEVYESVEEALARTAADAVYVATTVDRHRAAAVAALAAGKHVLVEKPLGLDAADAGQVVAAAARAGRVAGCAYYRRCSPRYAHLQGLLAAGTLGRIVAVRLCWVSWFSPAPDDPKYWRVVKSRSGGGPLADVGAHFFDLVIGLFGLPRRVFACCDTLANAYEVEDSAAVVGTLANGAQLSAQFGWNTKTWRQEFEVVGTEGKVLWLPADTGKVSVTIGRATEELDLPSAANVHEPLVRDFEAAIRDGRPPRVPLAEAAQTNRLLDAIYQSAREHREVSV